MNSVRSRAMILPLEGQKLVDRGYCFWVSGSYPHLSTSLQISRVIGDLPAQSAHYPCARHIRDCVYPTRDREVAKTECPRDIAHVGTNDRFASGIGTFHLQNDPSAIRERLKDVGRGVLIYTHRSRASLLQSYEG